VDDDSLSRVSIDTTVMEKNIAYPTDARLYEKARAKIVALAQEAGVQLRQTYARKAPLPETRCSRSTKEGLAVCDPACRFKNAVQIRV
jgi:IS5 family transposase